MGFDIRTAIQLYIEEQTIEAELHMMKPGERKTIEPNEVPTFSFKQDGKKRHWKLVGFEVEMED